jgi:hypothetical protein
MADNTILNAGSGGDTIASDDIASVKFQRIKVTLGADGVNDLDVSNSNPMPVYYPSVTPVDKSGTITTGDTAQVLAASNSVRRGWWIKNNSSYNLYVSDITTAVIGNASLEIIPGALYECPITGCSPSALSIIGSVTGQGFTAREW